MYIAKLTVVHSNYSKYSRMLAMAGSLLVCKKSCRGGITTGLWDSGADSQKLCHFYKTFQSANICAQAVVYLILIWRNSKDFFQNFHPDSTYVLRLNATLLAQISNIFSHIRNKLKFASFKEIIKVQWQYIDQIGWSIVNIIHCTMYMWT